MRKTTRTSFITSLIALSLLLSGCGESPTSLKKQNAQIFIIGDSTVYNASEGEMGWGSALKDYMNTPSYAYNRARVGASSKSFKNTSYSKHDWENTKALMKEKNIDAGAYLFIQFGANDVAEDYRHTEPGRFNSYYIELETYITEARELGVTPVLVTSINRQHKAYHAHGDYPITMRELAEDTNVLLLDLENKSYIEFSKYEDDKAIQDIFSYDDPSHFNPYGAHIVAGWVKELVCQKDQTLCSQFK